MVYNVSKRFFDVVCAILGIVGTSPIWIVSIILTEVSDPGPLFYFANRVGKEYNEKVLPVRLKLDVYYVRHASFFGDLKLILWTVIAIAYTACGKYPQWMHDRLVMFAGEG